MTSSVKSNQKSNLCRSQGNQLYANKSFFDALVAYNESLCLAESGTDNLGLAYANKSAVYFEMKLFDKCLRNVELARWNHYPEKNLEILKKREEKCIELKKNFKEDKKPVEPWQLFKISQPHKTLPFISDCLEMKADKKFGRHLITNRSLRPGEVVAIESPFCRIVQQKFIHQRCVTCFKDDLLDLVPCLGCNKGGCTSIFLTKVLHQKFFPVMFCSTCGSDQKVHFLECSVPENLITLLTSTQRMALQTFFTALSLFDGSVEQLAAFLTENPQSRTVFDLQTIEDKKQMLLAVHSLVSNCETNVDNSKLDDIFTKTPVLSEMWASNGAFIKSFLKKQTQIATLNYHEIYAWPLKRGGFLSGDESSQALAYKRNVASSGNGSFPFCALVNHSCASNVCKIFIDGKLLFVVTMPIDKGEQLFDSYGYSFTNVPKDYRQAELLKSYRFKCECAACKHDWPLMPNLKVIDKACFNKAKKACRDLSTCSGQITQKKAFESFQEACNNIERGRKNFPSIELCSLLESASAFLELSYKPAVLFPWEVRLVFKVQTFLFEIKINFCHNTILFWGTFGMKYSDV